MTDDDYDALSQKQLASIKRDMRISLEDAAVRATHKVMAEIKFDDGLLVQEDAFEGRVLLRAAPPKREWVGLTDEEIEAIGDKVANEQLVGPVANFRVRLARAIEQTLKEKNHG